MTRTEHASFDSLEGPSRRALADIEKEPTEGRIRIFLIADIRGYTEFTQARGDEAAAALAIRFADIVAESVGARDGSLIEIRGDEALAVFGSPRQAIRAAVDLQDRSVEESRATPDRPLPIGIGIDVGEAVPVGDGYRGGALNLAARLCNEAGPGEILASEGVVHLARTLDGIAYRDRGPTRLKGMTDPVNVVTIVAVGSDAAKAMRDLAPTRERGISRGQLQFRILGDLTVEAGTTSLPLGGPKQRGVLAHLLIHANELIPTETLIDGIWGEAPPENARNIIQIHISHLRKALGHDRIDGHQPGYRLRLDPSELDAARFDSLVREAKRALPIDPNVAVRTLDEALALWRGPAFADLVDLASIQPEATRLDELRVEAQEVRIDCLLTTGASASALQDAETLLARHPWRERVWGQLILALYREGRQADALNAFQRAREILADELGIDPSPELAKLQERVLRQDTSLELRGEPLRGYRLLEKLGDGPTGVVFRAIQPHVERDVAIKIFHEHIAADPAFIGRFEPEAQSVAALEHPHIAPVYDYWREPGRAHLAARFLRGGSLRGIWDRGESLDRARALRALEQIASALAYAHAQGVTHGHITAANVLFDEEGNAYLTDFPVGKARGVDQAADVRQLGELGAALSDGEAPRAVAELLDRASSEVGSSARAIAEAAREALGPPTSAPHPPDDVRNPYKGLRAFSEADARDFFGRAGSVRRLLTALTSGEPGSRFLAVVGPSGSGKSSVVRAGVVPAVRDGALGGREDYLVAEMYPGAHPLEELQEAIERVAARPLGAVRERLLASSRGLVDTVELVAPDAGILLVVDQFEEAFTLTSDDREREAFLENLRVATSDPGSKLHVIVTLRADFYDRPLLYPRFGELLAAHTQAIPPLTPDELESAIRGPAEGVGMGADPGMVAEMIADVAHQPGALPLLQFALTELFERREDGRLTLNAYHHIGGVAGALSASADRLYLDTDDPGRHAMRQVFLRLVTLGEGRQDTRRRVARSELDQLEGEPSTVDAVLRAYGAHRILTFDREPASREPTVEIAHEALLGSWRRLRSWIDGAREDLRQELGLRRAAAEWRSSDRDPSFLIRGARLEQLERWADGTSLAIGRPERAYLKASFDQRDRERSEEQRRRDREARTERRSRTRLRALVVVLTTAALVAGSLTIVATNQSERAGRQADRAERQATISRSRELAAAALANLDVDPELSILLAMEAVDVTRSVDGSVLREAEDALHGSVMASRVMITLSNIGDAAAWGRGLIATENTSQARGIDLRDEVTGTIIRTIRAGGNVTDLVFGADGRTLAATLADGRLRIWDATTGATIGSVNGKDAASGVSSAAVADRIAAAWPHEGVVRVIDGTSGEVVERIAVPGALETALRPDGDAVAVSQERQVAVLDVGTGRRLFDPLVPSTGNSIEYTASAVAWSPDGGSIAAASTFLDVWDAATGRLEWSRLAKAGSVAWSPDSTRLATGTFDNVVRIWSQSPFDYVGELTLTATELNAGIVPEGLDFSPDGSRVIAASVDGGTAKVWDVSAGGDAEVGNLETVGYYGSVAFLPGGRRIVAPDRDGVMAWWDPTTGERGPQLGPRIGHEYRFDVTDDGRWIAFGKGTSVTAWDVRTGGSVFSRRFPRHIENVDWTPDGRFLLAASGGRVVVLDRNGDVLAVPWATSDGPQGESARFSPDGTLMATIGSQVTVWDWRRHQVVAELPAAGWNLSFDPTGRSIVTVSEDRPPEVWDLTNGERRAVLGDRSDVLGAAFSPDGAIVALGGETVRLFDARNGDPLQTFGGHPAHVFGLAFSADGSMLASQSPALIRVWALDIDALLDVARRDVTRAFTDAECQRYLHVPRCAPATGTTSASSGT